MVEYSPISKFAPGEKARATRIQGQTSVVILTAYKRGTDLSVWRNAKTADALAIMVSIFKTDHCVTGGVNFNPRFATRAVWNDHLQWAKALFVAFAITDRSTTLLGNASVIARRRNMGFAFRS